MTTVSTGLKIQTIRQLRGVTQFGLANRMGISRVVLSYIENGRATLTPERRQAIEQVFGLRLDDPLVDAAFAVLASTEADRHAVLDAIAALEQPNGR